MVEINVVERFRRGPRQELKGGDGRGARVWCEGGSQHRSKDSAKSYASSHSNRSEIAARDLVKVGDFQSQSETESLCYAFTRPRAHMSHLLATVPFTITDLETQRIYVPKY
jgi:hypothetical protein